jgi:predicted helicase
MPKNLSKGNHAQTGGELQSPTKYDINDILAEIRQKSLTEKEKGTDFERLMKLWFLTDPRYANLQEVWLWEEFRLSRFSRCMVSK